MNKSAGVAGEHQTDAEMFGERTHYGARICPITHWEEANEALRSRALSADAGGPGDEHYRGGTVLRLDGDTHKRRRRAMGLLLRKQGHQWFRDTALIPTAREAMQKLLAGAGPTGKVQVELQQWISLVNIQLSAAMVGLDRARTPEGAVELLRLISRHGAGFPGAFSQTIRGFDPEGELERDALAAHAEFEELFYRPAFERRRALLDRLQAGEADASELPHDLITLIAKGEDPAWLEDEVAVKEAIFLTPAAFGTTTGSVIWTLDELFDWFDAHPEDFDRRLDTEFLNRAVSEALRLHPIVPGLPRLVVDDVHLSHGTDLEVGDLAIVATGPSGIAPDVWGEDALEFNPWRETPKGALAYGLAFGSGPHMCYGLPIAMGAEGLDGTIVFWLKTLFEAGVERDAEHPTNAPGREWRGRFAPRRDGYTVFLGGGR
jgi:cytochrome P450